MCLYSPSLEHFANSNRFGHHFEHFGHHRRPFFNLDPRLVIFEVFQQIPALLCPSTLLEASL
jgi:hypothetical protein